MRHRLIPILLFPLLAWAHVASGQPIQLGYAGYVAGLKVFAFHAAADLGGDGYRMQTSYRTSGVLGAFVSGDLHSMAAGSWRPSGPAPLQFQTWGVWRGDPRAVLIDYAGGQPEVRKLLPSIEGERDPVPRADQANTIDMLSGFAQLARQMNANGRCEANTKLFDGRRLVTVAVTHAGPEILAADSASMFTGQAVRCDIDSRQIAGFAFDSGRDPAATQTQGSLWFARPMPGAPMVPVRMSLQLQMFGRATMYLATATLDRGPIAANIPAIGAPQADRPSAAPAVRPR